MEKGQVKRRDRRERVKKGIEREGGSLGKDGGRKGE